jgi:putative membrane protein
MKPQLEAFFTEADRKAVEEAVSGSESGTGGEIVPYAVGRSDAYRGAAWKGAALGAALMGIVAGAVYQAGGFWGGLLPLWMALPPAAGAALGFMLPVAWPGLRRWLVDAELMELRVRQRALAAFVEEEVFNTNERTGILLFVSLFEHRVVVLGDAGINATVEPREWEEVVSVIAAGIRAGRPGAALAEGIRLCGALLAARVERRPRDTDELANRLRTAEE